MSKITRSSGDVFSDLDIDVIVIMVHYKGKQDHILIEPEFIDDKNVVKQIKDLLRRAVNEQNA